MNNWINGVKLFLLTKKGYMDRNVSMFLHTLDEFADLDEEPIEKQKVTKIIRTIRKSFEPLEIITIVYGMDFNAIFSALLAQI